MSSTTTHEPARENRDGGGGASSALIPRLEAAAPLDPIVATLDGVANTVTAGALGPFLRGEWLGHPVHPMLTDVPIGCWTSANVLDLLGRRRARPAAKLLVALGVLSAVPTVAAGLADFGGLDDQRTRRVAAAHAAGNAAATVLYVLSWRARRRHQHWRGVALALAGSGVATAAGYLGGHLAFGATDDAA